MVVVSSLEIGKRLRSFHIEKLSRQCERLDPNEFLDRKYFCPIGETGNLCHTTFNPEIGFEPSIL